MFSSCLVADAQLMTIRRVPSNSLARGLSELWLPEWCWCWVQIVGLLQSPSLPPHELQSRGCLYQESDCSPMLQITARTGISVVPGQALSPGPFFLL